MQLLSLLSFLKLPVKLLIVFYSLIATLEFCWACPEEPTESIKKVTRHYKSSTNDNLTAKLLKKIDIPKKFAGRNIRFGDLTGDGKSEIIIAQNQHGQNVTHLLALTLEGETLWKWGEGKINAFHTPRDLGVQIYDWNGDGKGEVLIIQEGQLYLLNGTTGAIIQQVEVNIEERDVVFIANLLSSSQPALLLKSRYDSFSIYDQNFNKVYSRDLNTGHFPMAYDFNLDGIDELIIGYSLFDFTKLPADPLVWEHPEIPLHNDAVDVGDMNHDDVPIISIAASDDGYLIKSSGEIIKTYRMRHAQHTAFGHFRGTEQEEVAFLDRAMLGVVKILNLEGRKFWQSKPFGFLTMINAVDGWSGKQNKSFLLVSRADFSDPSLYNAKGKLIAKFPFPPAKHPSGRYGEHYTQHFDILGDCREEVIVYNEKNIWIYGNPTPTPQNCLTSEKLPLKRISRASFYTGFQ